MKHMDNRTPSLCFQKEKKIDCFADFSEYLFHYFSTAFNGDKKQKL